MSLADKLSDIEDQLYSKLFGFADTYWRDPWVSTIRLSPADDNNCFSQGQADVFFLRQAAQLPRGVVYDNVSQIQIYLVMSAV